jgi:hypothetical protein
MMLDGAPRLWGAAARQPMKAFARRSASAS